ncbi:nuclear transport factor 2 family protein [Aestuariivivens insulae]|uniref:nuclear transport factor 2 family protein n=1 Tax=Aestuariivivens insulae TaxID=1621988 RepID=UPI001F570AD5|nr:nuclear transport factor 2 family protein [Aestuariivivens insulae]
MNRTEVANSYLKYLENGNIEQIIALFDEDGIVESPLYGTKSTSVFYNTLNNDTSASKLNLKGIFEQINSNTIALYFTYIWTLKNNETVTFDVVDIIEFSAKNKIKTLKIIYDTAITRKLVERLNEQ